MGRGPDPIGNTGINVQEKLLMLALSWPKNILVVFYFSEVFILICAGVERPVNFV